MLLICLCEWLVPICKDWFFLNYEKKIPDYINPELLVKQLFRVGIVWKNRQRIAVYQSLRAFFSFLRVYSGDFTNQPLYLCGFQHRISVGAPNQTGAQLENGFAFFRIKSFE